jgi:hypothetical protein
LSQSEGREQRVQTVALHLCICNCSCTVSITILPHLVEEAEELVKLLARRAWSSRNFFRVDRVDWRGLGRH